jgi:hypothetical protein
MTRIRHHKRNSNRKFKSAPVRLFSPQTYFKDMPTSQANLYVDYLRTELTLHDGSILTFPFADNNIPNMLTDWQPIVGITFQDQPIMTDTKSISMSVAQETNQNLSKAQKELLTWHWKLGHCHFSWVQRLFKKKTPTRTVGGTPPLEMRIREGDLQAGDCVSVDQYVSSVPGRLPNTMGKEPSKLKYHGGTIFIDHASSSIYLVNQTSLRAGETL